MELNYKYAESTVQPTALEVTVGTVYLRKDITSITRTSEQGDKTTYWTYQEAALTPQEFNEYTNLLMLKTPLKVQMIRTTLFSSWQVRKLAIPSSLLSWKQLLICMMPSQQ
jgi:hypothetical protein